MTRQKTFKTRIRSRMEKTGESYTTARRQLLGKPGTSGAAPGPDPAELQASSPGTPAPETQRPQTHPPESRRPQTRHPEPSGLENAAVQALRLPDETVRKRTGRGTDEWFTLLDAWGAGALAHTEIARRLVEVHQVDGWWAQSITVAYEQARGLRAPGQRTDGTFSVSATKTVAVPAERLHQAFADEHLRAQWLPDASIRVRTATPPRSFRADWEEDGTRIVVGLVTKGDGRAQVAVQHIRIPNAEAAGRIKTYWRERLAVLKQLLEQ
ncbi:hypothetical protein [Streptomyces sparsus]